MEKKYVFPKVELPDVGRSNHNLDKAIMFSFSPGTARPIWSRDVLPGDHWEVSFNASIESLPMLAPLYGAWKANWAFYFEPWSNVYGWMDNNVKQSTNQILSQNLMRYALPILNNGLNVTDDWSSVIDYNAFAYNLNFDSVAPSSVWEDFGWPTNFKPQVVGTIYYNESSIDNLYEDLANYELQTTEALDSYVDFLQIPRTYRLAPYYLHAIKPLAYLDIIRNYYVNNQLGYVEYISADQDIDKKSYVKSVDIKVLDYIFMFLRSVNSTQYHSSDVTWQDLANIFRMHDHLPGYGLEHTSAIGFLLDWEKSYSVSNGGCFLTNYQMDLNRGLLATTVGNYSSTVDTSSGSFSIDTLRMQNKIQQLIDIIDLTGGRFSDWVRALWSVNIKGDVDKPIYLGSVSQTIGSTDVISPSTTSGSLAGSQTGFAAGGLKSRKITFNSDIYGTIMCVFSYTPIVMYSNLFKREDVKTTFADIYNPRMSQLGYQDVPKAFLSAEPRSYSTFLSTSNQGLINLSDGITPYEWVVYSQSNSLNTLVGKQVAWAEYMSDIDESRGIFANRESLEYWVLNRDYFYNKATQIFYGADIIERRFDGSTYVDPAKYQNLFADVEPNAQNFRQFIKFNVFVKRPIPKRTLGRL